MDRNGFGPGMDSDGRGGAYNFLELKIKGTESTVGSEEKYA